MVLFNDISLSRNVRCVSEIVPFVSVISCWQNWLRVHPVSPQGVFGSKRDFATRCESVHCYPQEHDGFCKNFMKKTHKEVYSSMKQDLIIAISIILYSLISIFIS